jgi:hypothetical protein
VVEGILSTSGCSYFLGDLSWRSHSAWQITRNPKLPGGQLKSRVIEYMPSESTVTVQLYDVTVDRALDIICPPVGLVYRKQGPPANPTYVITTAAAELTGVTEDAPEWSGIGRKTK